MNKRTLVIGDLHGCWDEFEELLVLAKFNPEQDLVVSVGDLTDRGPASDKVLRFFMEACRKGCAEAVLGNHCDKLRRHLKGNNVSIRHGLQLTLEQIANWSEEERLALFYFLENRPLVFENDHVIVTHAAYKSTVSAKHAHNLAMYGEITGETGTDGHPVRLNLWEQDYQGPKPIVHGHIVEDDAPVKTVSKNGSHIWNVDGGCCFGGNLVMMEFPSLKVYKVKAKKVYCES